jgi:hypothetical protein
MNDDWRLQVDLDDPDSFNPLVERLEARELEHDLEEAFHDRVIVSRNDDLLFLYAGTREQAERARTLLETLDLEHDWKLTIDLKRWHPAAEEWRDPDEPLPDDESERATERGRLMAAERRQAEEAGRFEFEVRIDLPSRHEAVRLAKRLEDEGLPVARRWSFILVGAYDEDEAKTLAERLRGEAPAGSEVAAEGTWGVAYAERSPNPFAVFGGLGE